MIISTCHETSHYKWILPSLAIRVVKYPVRIILTVFKVIKDVWCPVSQTWKKNRSKKSLKAPNYHDIHAYEWVCVNFWPQLYFETFKKEKKCVEVHFLFVAILDYWLFLFLFCFLESSGNALLHTTGAPACHVSCLQQMTSSNYYLQSVLEIRNFRLVYEENKSIIDTY